MKEYRFKGEILANQKYPNAAYLVFPYDVVEEFGSKGQVKILAWFDGVEYRGSLAPMMGTHILIMVKDIRTKLGKTHGDFVEVVLQQDLTPRIVEIPEDINEILLEYKLLKVFKKLSYSKQKEQVESISSAKRSETKERRILKLITTLKGSKS